ncbi:MULTISPECIES: hypothetical protein [unclassified Pseudomonas]|uniref:hypothetical protein n=1 Tax=unclassified Pseudomonas TaxID=196821 RepID=UPI00257EE2EC|nr:MULTISPECIES: hypothetical protein [unclassified Pseudomonas]
MHPSTDIDQLLEAVEVPALLEDIPGGDSNLLPKSATSQALRVVVPMWPFSDPQPGEPELLRLYWDDSTLVDDRAWETPVQPEDLVLSVPVERLTDGPHVLSYEVQGSNGDVSVSEILQILIDLVPPALGGVQGALTVVEDPEEIERDGLTERYLRSHGQRLRTEVPNYTTPKAGDTIIYYWDTVPFSEMYAGEHVLAYEDVGGPHYIDFGSELILERGDGECYLYYAVQDRAGNISLPARPLILKVDAGVRTLPLPGIAQATGTGSNLRLAINDLLPPLLVKVPAEATVYPDETLRVEWGQPNDPGYFSTSTEYQGRAREFEIPTEKVLAQGATSIKVNYVVSGDEQHDYLSPSIDLTIAPLSGNNLPRVQLAGVSSGAFELSKAPERNPVTLATWRFMAVGQLVDIWVSGVLKNGQPAQPFKVLESYAVRQSDLTNGIGSANNVVVLKSFLSTLMLNNSFTLHVQVSFDGGREWVAYPALSPTLRA